MFLFRKLVWNNTSFRIIFFMNSHYTPICDYSILTKDPLLWDKVVKFIKVYTFALLFWTPQPLPASFLLKSALENGSNHLHIWKNIQKKCRRNDGVQKNCPLVLLLPKKPCGPFKRDSTNRKADEILRCMTRCYIVYRVLLSN